MGRDNRLFLILGIILLISAGGFAVTTWVIPAINRERAKPYLSAFKEAEKKYGLPPDLLNRMAYQESRYDAAAVSPVGALGIMQFMPATAKQYNIDPLDPYQSIDAAGKYIRALYDQFKDWPTAIAAYNWGPGNMAKHIKSYGGLNVSAIPDETRKYLSIAEDIGIA